MALAEKIKAKADELAATIRRDSYGFNAPAVLALTAELTLLLAEKAWRESSDYCSLEKEG